jgi:carboxylate-amine ligase
MDEPEHEPTPSADRIRAAFEDVTDLTIGIEEEVLLVDAASGEPAPRADEVMERLGEDEVDGCAAKLELPAAQLELMTAPTASTTEAVARLARGRARLAAALPDGLAAIGAGASPLGTETTTLHDTGRYANVSETYGFAVLRQLVCALQVHVAVRGADRALAVHNGLRSYLPETAALAANAPYHAGEDSGFASVRPPICTMLPRQGVPPALTDWEELATALRRMDALKTMSSEGQWWWELRPHTGFGTLEVRVPDTQIDMTGSRAVIAFVHSLVAWLAECHDAGEPLPSHPSWLIGENRWAACRAGVECDLGDLDGDGVIPARERIGHLVELLGPAAAGLGCEEDLASVAGLCERNGAIRQREIAAERGINGLVAWLAESFAR